MLTSLLIKVKAHLRLIDKLGRAVFGEDGDERYATKEDFYALSERLDNMNSSHHYKPFCCKTASAEEIRNRCLKLGKSDEYADFMVMAFRSGKTQKEIGSMLNLAESTVRKYKRLRAAELEGRNK